jgi:hypothetical protein
LVLGVQHDGIVQCATENLADALHDISSVPRKFYLLQRFCLGLWDEKKTKRRIGGKSRVPKDGLDDGFSI